MTNQEIFDKVLNALREQGIPSRNDYGTCMYRGNHDLKCAIGHLIPDELYTPDIEKFGMIKLIEQVTFGEHVFVQFAINKLENIMRQIGIAKPQYNFLLKLQVAHDQFLCYGLEEWENRMKVIAYEFNLQYNESVDA